MIAKYFTSVLIAALVFSAQNSWALGQKEQWYAPKALSDSNAHVRFEVDSTWHLVQGKTKNLTGTLSLKDNNDPTSVEVSVELPVSDFDTDDSDRDEEMRSVMASDKHPTVKFHGIGLKKGCTPASTESQGVCKDVMAGELTIRGNSRPVEMPLVITFSGGKFNVKGELPVKWADYNVEDPSIFIARLHDVVTIFFEVDLQPK